MYVTDLETVLITGGAGFIGSNLAHELVKQDVNVRILDSFSDEYGANHKNLSEIEQQIRVIRGDVCDNNLVSDLVSDVDVVFHLAAQLSRTISMEQPQTDIKTNCQGTITVLEAVRQHNPTAKVIYTGSQAVFGKPAELPLTETTPTDPIDIYGTNKLAAEQYCKNYSRSHDLFTTTLRLTNVYGPRSQLSNPNYGVINNFINAALQGEPLTVFEPGTMKRDPIFVSDVVEALLRAADCKEANGESFVIGSGSPVTIKELANHIVDISGNGIVETTPWPEEWERIKVGDIYVDPEKASKLLDWTATTDLNTGLERTLDYSESHRDAYLP